MDAFAVSVCKGLTARNAGVREMLTAGAWFGSFQGIMPFLGWILGSRFRVYIERADHWIAFSLLVIIGLNMIREAVSHKGGDEAEKEKDAGFGPRTMLLMAVATSIDALAVGITFGLFLDGLSRIVTACAFICAITFILSAAGVKAGSMFGLRFEKRAEIAGGVILILIGVKILLEHSGIINF